MSSFFAAFFLPTTYKSAGVIPASRIMARCVSGGFFIGRLNPKSSRLTDVRLRLFECVSAGVTPGKRRDIRAIRARFVFVDVSLYAHIRYYTKTAAFVCGGFWYNIH